MNYQDQLTLLSDILRNQQQSGFGTADEYSQIQRLVEDLQKQGQLDENMQQTLATIADYCINKSCAQDTPHNQWIQSVDEITMPYPHE
jgi:hypothetical protein